MRTLFERLRSDTGLQDPAYDPPFSDFNPVIDNHGTAINVTVPKATARIKFRYSARIDPAPVLAAVHDAAARHGIAVSEAREGGAAGIAGRPSAGAALRRDGREAGAHRPVRHRRVGAAGARTLRRARPRRHRARRTRRARRCRIAELAAAVPVFMRLAERLA